MPALLAVACLQPAVAASKAGRCSGRHRQGPARALIRLGGPTLGDQLALAASKAHRAFQALSPGTPLPNASSKAAAEEQELQARLARLHKAQQKPAAAAEAEHALLAARLEQLTADVEATLPRLLEFGCGIQEACELVAPLTAAGNAAMQRQAEATLQDGLAGIGAALGAVRAAERRVLQHRWLAQAAAGEMSMAAEAALARCKQERGRSPFPELLLCSAALKQRVDDPLGAAASLLGRATLLDWHHLLRTAACCLEAALEPLAARLQALRCQGGAEQR